LADGRERTKFADLSAVTAISTKSVDLLSERLSAAVNVSRFRANLVLTGVDAFSEDHWRSFVVGPARFRVLKRTHRCVVCAVDQVPHRQRSGFIACLRVASLWW
jgi:MOSC domain-containing protein